MPLVMIVSGSFPTPGKAAIFEMEWKKRKVLIV